MEATVAAGAVLAAGAWGWLFALGRDGFWWRAMVAGVAIGAYGVVAQRDGIGDLLWPTVADVAIGVVGAVVLYGVFWAGDAVLRRWVPWAAAHVDELYEVRAVPASARLPVPAVIPFVGACEELFWRGLVQARAGFVVALAAYAAVHPVGAQGGAGARRRCRWRLLGWPVRVAGDAGGAHRQPRPNGTWPWWCGSRSAPPGGGGEPLRFCRIRP